MNGNKIPAQVIVARLMDLNCFQVFCTFSDQSHQFITISELECDLARIGRKCTIYAKAESQVRDGTARGWKHWKEIEPILVSVLQSATL